MEILKKVEEIKKAIPFSKESLEQIEKNSVNLEVEIEIVDYILSRLSKEDYYKWEGGKIPFRSFYYHELSSNSELSLDSLLSIFEDKIIVSDNKWQSKKDFIDNINLGLKLLISKYGDYFKSIKELIKLKCITSIYNLSHLKDDLKVNFKTISEEIMCRSYSDTDCEIVGVSADREFSSIDSLVYDFINVSNCIDSLNILLLRELLFFNRKIDIEYPKESTKIIVDSNHPNPFESLIKEEGTKESAGMFLISDDIDKVD